jgi:hypothetical protein
MRPRRRQSIVKVVRVSVLDRHVAALGEAHFAQPLSERTRQGSVRPLRAGGKMSNHWHYRLLRPRRKRRRSCAAEKRNEVAPSHDQPSWEGADYHIVN